MKVLINKEESEVKKSNEEIADEIIKGICSDSRWDTWGNGQERKDRLAIAGYDATAIQSIVNEKLKGTSSKKSNEEIADEIIKGICSDSRWDTWGNGQERKDKLALAGYDATAIQKIINEKL